MTTDATILNVFAWGEFTLLHLCIMWVWVSLCWHMAVKTWSDFTNLFHKMVLEPINRRISPSGHIRFRQKIVEDKYESLSIKISLY